MSKINLFNICRLCMAALDNNTIDCSKSEHTELRENIELIYNLKISTDDEYSKKICVNCSEMVIHSTMQYIRAAETQINLKVAHRMQSEINNAIKRTTGTKRPLRLEQCDQPNCKKAKRKLNFENDEEAGKSSKKLKYAQNIDIMENESKKIKISRPEIAIPKLNNQNVNNRCKVDFNLSVKNKFNSPETFKPYQIQHLYEKPVQISKFNGFNSKKWTVESKPFPSSSMNVTNNLPSAFVTPSTKKSIINPFTAAEILKRVLNRDARPTNLTHTGNSLINVAKEFYNSARKPVNAPSNNSINLSPIDELTKQMAHLRLAGSRFLNKNNSFFHSLMDFSRFNQA